MLLMGNFTETPGPPLPPPLEILEHSAWSMPHVLVPFSLYMYNRNMGWTIALFMLWEMLEAVMWYLLSSYPIFPMVVPGRESIENSLIVDPSLGLVGLFSAVVLCKLFHMPPVGPMRYPRIIKLAMGSVPRPGTPLLRYAWDMGVVGIMRLGALFMLECAFLALLFLPGMVMDVRMATPEYMKASALSSAPVALQWWELDIGCWLYAICQFVCIAMMAFWIMGDKERCQRHWWYMTRPSRWWGSAKVTIDPRLETASRVVQDRYREMYNRYSTKGTGGGGGGKVNNSNIGAKHHRRAKSWAIAKTVRPGPWWDAHMSSPSGAHVPAAVSVSYSVTETMSWRMDYQHSYMDGLFAWFVCVLSISLPFMLRWHYSYTNIVAVVQCTLPVAFFALLTAVRRVSRAFRRQDWQQRRVNKKRW